jgi:hypothetical protein
MVEHPLGCDAWQETLAGWLVAQLPPDEEAYLVVHLETCDACRAEAESLFDVAAVLLGTDTGDAAPADAPSADLGDRITRRVARERRARRAGRMALAMSAAAAAVVVAVVVTRDPGPKSDRGEPVVFAREVGGADASAVVAPDGGGSVVHLVARGLEPGVTYSLWLTPPGGGYLDRVAAGTFRPDDAGAVDAELRSALPAEAMGRVWATTPEGGIVLDTEPA